MLYDCCMIHVMAVEEEEPDPIKEWKIVAAGDRQVVEWYHPKGTLREHLPQGIEYKLHRNDRDKVFRLEFNAENSIAHC